MRLLKLWIAYNKIAIKQWLVYKKDFLIIFLASIFSIIVPILNIHIIFSVTEEILGWNKEQVLWMYGYFMLIQALFNTFCINLFDVSDWLSSGKFDILKTRPCPLIFQLLYTERYNVEFPYDQYIVGAFLCFKHFNHIGVNWNWKSILFLLGVVISSFAIYSLLIFIISSMSFFFIKNNSIIDFLLELEQINQYPLNVYGVFVERLLTFFLPIGFVSYIPNKFIFSNFTNMYEFKYFPLVIGVLLLVSYSVWRFGLDNYQSYHG